MYFYKFPNYCALYILIIIHIFYCDCFIDILNYVFMQYVVIFILEQNCILYCLGLKDCCFTAKNSRELISFSTRAKRLQIVTLSLM